MISVQEARHSIFSSIRRLETEVVGLSTALGRVLSRDLYARVAHPQTDVSAMDGYAVRASDTTDAPVTLKVVTESIAGEPAYRTVEMREAARILTGAIVPAGADAVIPQEKVNINPEGAVIIQVPAVVGQYVRKAGLDFQVGNRLLKTGRRLTFRDVALAAAMNVLWIPVVCRPRVAIISTGSEICFPGEGSKECDVIDSNSFALSAFVSNYGGIPMNLGIARDDKLDLLALVETAKRSDLLLISGGISVGERDLVLATLAEAGMILHFQQVAVRPGKPLISGCLAGITVIGLPGNPVSTMVGATLFVLPALNALLGLPIEAGIERKTAKLTCTLPANDSREDYLRATWTSSAKNVIHVTPFSYQDSAMQTILAAADCLIIRYPHAPPAGAGDTVDLIVL